MKSGRTVPILETTIVAVPGRIVRLTLDPTGDRNALVRVDGATIFGDLFYDELLVAVGFCQRHLKAGSPAQDNVR